MDLQNKLKINAQEIEKEVKLILENWKDEVKDINPQLLPLIDEFIKSNKGGKKLRGFLVRLGYEIAVKTHLPGVKAHLEGEISKISSAYEILHTSILAHDDIIDQSLQRRDVPSLYQALGGNHYGVSQAICLADAGFFLSLKIISESKFEDKLKNQALQLFAKTMLDTAVGQMLDINLGERGKGKGESDEDMIQSVNLLKTARYTISGPLKLGAVLGGGNKKLLNLLDALGENLGIAYQIRDDILDGEVKSVDEAKVKALEYLSAARKILPKLTNNVRMKKLLEQLIKYMVERSK